MLDKVRIPGFFGTFVPRAGIHPNTYGDGFDGRDSLGDQANPVVEDDLAIQVLPTRWIRRAAGGRCRNSFFSTEADFPLLIDFKHFDQNLVPFGYFIRN